MFKTYLVIFTRECLRLLVRMLFVLPVKPNRILFESFQGRSFSDNPREVYRYLHRHYGDRFEYICSLTNPETHTQEGIRAVRYKSLLWLYYQITAGVIVSNVVPISIIPKRKGQLFIETWHGGGAYKTLADDFRGYDPATRKKLRWNRSLICEKIDVFLSSSRKFTEVGIERPYGYKGIIANTGMPRNDIFFDSEEVRRAAQKVRERYDLCGKVILYAPTWRGVDFTQTKKIDTLVDFDSLLSALDRTQKGTTILFRRHYADKNQYEYGDRVVDVSDYPDMQELLCAADILITDYSSSIWDYALLGRPCFLYVPDLHEYEMVEHGFCTDIHTWPGTVCADMDTLCREIIAPDLKAHEKKAGEHLLGLGSYENGTACRQVAERICSFIGQ